MANYQIVASDLDGTLLNSRGEVSEENWKAIAEMTARGVQFVPCTGRTLMEMNAEIRDNPSIRYIIHSDGAVVYDKQTDQRITACMKGERLRWLMSLFFQYDVQLCVRTNKRSYMDSKKLCSEWFAYYRQGEYDVKELCNRAIGVENFEAFCQSIEEAEMVSAVFREPKEYEEFKRRIKADGGYLFAPWDAESAIEVFDATAGKGSALLRLAQHLGLDPSQTIGVGDSCNDLTLIGAAGLGLCMENGYEEPKRIADAIICNNDEHPMQYIYKRFICAEV